MIRRYCFVSKDGSYRTRWRKFPKDGGPLLASKRARAARRRLQPAIADQRENGGAPMSVLILGTKEQADIQAAMARARQHPVPLAVLKAGS